MLVRSASCRDRKPPGVTQSQPSSLPRTGLFSRQVCPLRRQRLRRLRLLHRRARPLIFSACLLKQSHRFPRPTFQLGSVRSPFIARAVGPCFKTSLCRPEVEMESVFSNRLVAVGPSFRLGTTRVQGPIAVSIRLLPFKRLEVTFVLPTLVVPVRVTPATHNAASDRPQPPQIARTAVARPHQVNLAQRRHNRPRHATGSRQ